MRVQIVQPSIQNSGKGGSCSKQVMSSIQEPAFQQPLGKEKINVQLQREPIPRLEGGSIPTGRSQEAYGYVLNPAQTQISQGRVFNYLEMSQVQPKRFQMQAQLQGMTVGSRGQALHTAQRPENSTYQVTKKSHQVQRPADVNQPYASHIYICYQKKPHITRKDPS